MLTLLIPASVVRADSVVTLADPGLEAAIRAAIGKPTGDIYQSDLDGITSLGANYAGIVDLTGLEHCTSLKSLDLEGNQISDISPLSGLTSLTRLSLGSNQISDISPLSGLTSLGTLWLGYNQITNLPPLSGLTSLSVLYLYGNQITNLSQLSGPSSLSLLNLDNNQISDISPLSGLTSLTELGLQGNQISDISPLSGHTGLTALNLWGNQIIDMSPLSGLTSMDVLYLSGNQITNISPLSGVTSLTDLLLDSNQISDISPLSGLTRLTRLWLMENQISNISPLSSLTSLTYLGLDSNQISDIGPLVSNTGLGTGDYVILSSNPLSPTSIYDYIPQLQARGVTVDWLWGSPTISSVSPGSSVQGQMLSSVVITGTYFAGATNVSLGLGVTVNSFVVDNSTQITADITVSGSAATGGRNVSVTTPAGIGILPGMFSVAYDGPPSRPSNVSSPNGASTSSLTPTLQSSLFSDPDSGDTHAASQWQLTTTADNYSSPVFDSGTDASNLTSITVPPSLLNYSTTYYWHVRQKDNHGVWSEWSAETSLAVGHSPNQPSNIVLPTAATGVSLTPTLQCSPFSDPDSGNLHSASQWQVRTTSVSYSSPIYDSGTDNANLTITTIPSGLLSHSTTYCWHVRYQDNTGLWSDWSAESFFTTAKGGSPFWLWIIVGLVVVLTAGSLAYLVGKRRPAR